MHRKFNASQQNCIYVTSLLLKLSNVKVNTAFLERLLYNHPDFPSLLSIHDCLIELKTQPKIFKINKEEFLEKNIDYPFITFNPKHGVFQFIQKPSQTNLIISHVHGKVNNFQVSEFLDDWTGLILQIKPNQDSGEQNYFSNKVGYITKKLLLPFAIISLLCLLVGGAPVEFWNDTQIIITLIALTGLLITLPLMITLIDANSSLVKDLCIGGSLNVCGQLLKSKASKLTSWLSWSEVGFLYFLGCALTSFLIPNALLLLFIFSMAALPYPFYSIAFQFKNKKWCTLCCSVQAVLVLQGLILLNWFRYYQYQSVLDNHAIINSIACFLVPTVCWFLVKPILVKYFQHGPLEEQLKKLKFDYQLFRVAIERNMHMPTNPELEPIVLGNPNAKTVITMVSNPYCKPCAAAHAVLDQWLSIRSDFRLEILFNTSGHRDDVANHLYAINRQNDEHFIKKALTAWYTFGVQDYEKWSADYPVKVDGSLQLITEKRQRWCQQAKIAYTPTIMFNGRKLPYGYELEDLKYLIN